MAAITYQWNPDDWEVFAHHLLQCRHGALNVHKVPAKDKGDLGIDYYCTADGVAYQCYAVEEPISVAVRAKKQKYKITKDLGKLQKNSALVAKLFYGKPVKKWVLLCPLHDSKEVNIHCANKTVEIRGKSYSYIDDTFEVCVHDSSVFDADALKAGMANINMVNLSVPDPTGTEIGVWAAKSQSLLVTARTKLAKRASGTDLDVVVADATKFFLKGAALMDALRSSAPELHDKLLGAIASRRRHLEFAGPLGGPTPNSILQAEIGHLTHEVLKAAPNLSQVNVDQIVYGTLSEWIMQCPLDFPNAQ